jgi:hypothetical protein
MLTLLVLAQAVTAQTVYRWVDEQGRVTYQDQPPPEGVSGIRIDLKPDGYYAWTDEQGRRHYSDTLPQALAPAAQELAAASATDATDAAPGGSREISAAPLAALLVALFVVAGFMFLHARLRARLGAWRVRREIVRAGAALHGIWLPDGLGGRARIDHLVKLPGGLLVVDVMSCRGRIFGGPKDADWVERRGRRARNFPNPIRQNRAHLAVVRAHAGSVPVFGTVVSTGGARFPNGRPDGVIDPRGLKAILRHGTTPAVDAHALDAAWAAVQAAGLPPDRSRNT